MTEKNNKKWPDKVVDKVFDDPKLALQLVKGLVTALIVFAGTTGTCLGLSLGYLIFNKFFT